ncbi:MAG: amidinotransferase [Deltaproteobacteria bacterium]|nr:amidinotransferase [Deltaproteobacteria bacterium]
MSNEEVLSNKKPCPVRSYDEWSPLEEVVVGTVQGSMYPECGPILAANGEPEWLWHYQGEFMEEEVVERADEQLSGFVELLEDGGVKVRRPEPLPLNQPYSTPYWSTKSSWNTANPRDLFLVVGDEIIECASPMRHRHFESLAYRKLFTHYFDQGAKWTSAPRPALREPLFDYSFMEKPIEEASTVDDKTLPDGAKHHYPITEHEPVFEAADFVRCGKDLFVTQSIVTNQGGIKWVRRHLPEGFAVHEIATRCSAPCHIDTTFLPLRPGLAVINPEWVKEIPDALKNWTLIKAPAPSYHEKSPMAHPYFTSQWLSMNVFSLDEEHVFVDAQQVELMRMFEQHGLTPIPVPFDYVGMFGGSFHCVTLDIRRKSELASYL